jgi:hypothetical protein
MVPHQYMRTQRRARERKPEKTIFLEPLRARIVGSAHCLLVHALDLPVVLRNEMKRDLFFRDSKNPGSRSLETGDRKNRSTVP